MAKINSKNMLSKEINCLLENCTIEQIEVEDYIDKLMECGFMSKNAVQQRKEKTNNLRYWFVAYIPKLFCSLAFYQTTSETAYKVKTQSKDIYELPENIASLLLRSGERKPIRRFVDISRGIFIPQDVFAPANVQNDKQDYVDWQIEQLQAVASDLQNVIPFHDEADITYKNFIEELSSSSRKVWYEKHLANGTIEQTNYYYPKLIYCLQFIFRARNLEFLRNKLKAMNSIKEAEVRKSYLEKVERFLKEVKSLYENCVTTLYKTMYVISKLDEPLLEKAEIARENIRKSVMKGSRQKTVNEKVYLLNEKNEVIDEYPEIFMIYYRVLSSADLLVKKIQKFYDNQQKEDVKNISMPFTRYSNYDATWMDLFSKVIHSGSNLNNTDELALKKNDDLEDTFIALQNAQQLEKERLKAEAMALKKEEDALQKQRAFVLSLEQSKNKLENFICKQFIPIVLEYRNVKETLRANKILDDQAFIKQVASKFASNEALDSTDPESAIFAESAAYDVNLIQSLYEDLKTYDEKYEDSVLNGKLQQFISSIKTTGEATYDTKSQEYVQITKFIARAETGVLTHMMQAVDHMQKYVAVAKACLDRYQIATRYAEARDVFWNIEQEKMELQKLISLLPVCKDVVMRMFTSEVAENTKLAQEFFVQSQLDMQMLGEYQKNMKQIMAKYTDVTQRLTAVNASLYNFSSDIEDILQAQRNLLKVKLEKICQEHDLTGDKVKAHVDILLSIYNDLENDLRSLNLNADWEKVTDVFKVVEDIEEGRKNLLHFINETVTVFGKQLADAFRVDVEDIQCLGWIKTYRTEEFIQKLFEQTGNDIIKEVLQSKSKDVLLDSSISIRVFLDNETEMVQNTLKKINEVCDDDVDENKTFVQFALAVADILDKVQNDEQERYALDDVQSFFNDINTQLKELYTSICIDYEKHEEQRKKIKRILADESKKVATYFMESIHSKLKSTRGKNSF